MQRIIRKAGGVVLFVILFAAVTGIWACLWLPPY
jgi:hypothetical protein